jgi:MFS superfamily sulfate permease-like transporter
VGYMNGLAVTIIVGQLPKLFGFSTDADSFAEEIGEFVRTLPETNTATLLIGVGVLAVLLILPKFTRTIPAVLVAVVGATVLSGALDLAADGVSTVGTLPRGFPAPSFPWTSVRDAVPLVIAAVGITLVSLTDTIATSTSFAARRGDDVDPNQEMVGIGVANVAAGLFQGFAISTSTSRTAVATAAGARSQLSNLIGAGIVGLLLLFFNSLLAALPQSALAGVVIAAAISLLDLGALRRYAQVRRTALVLSLVATAGVIVLGVLEGIVVAIVLAVAMFFRRSWWPNGEVLGRVPDLEGWHSVSGHPDATEMDGIVVYRWEAPLFFANAGAFREQVRKLVRRRRPAWVILQCEAMTDIDVTAAEMLERLDIELNTAGVHVAFVEMRSRVQALVQRYGLFDTIERDHFYPTMDTALAAIHADMQNRPLSPEDDGGPVAPADDTTRSAGEDR